MLFPCKILFQVKGNRDDYPGGAPDPRPRSSRREVVGGRDATQPRSSVGRAWSSQYSRGRAPSAPLRARASRRGPIDARDLYESSSAILGRGEHALRPKGPAGRRNRPAITRKGARAKWPATVRQPARLPRGA